MQKIGKFIVKARYALLAIFVALVAVSCYLMTKVSINYDMTKYLDDDSSSSVSLEIMQEEFGSVGQAQIMVSGNKVYFTETEAEKISASLSEVEGVASVLFEAADVNYFKEVNGNNYAIYKAFLTTGNYEPETYETLDHIRAVIDTYNEEAAKALNVALNGGAVENEFLTNALDSDMTVILIIVGVVVLLILTIVSSSWIEPFIFAIVVVGAILINMGTNILLNHIGYIGNSMSFITKSIAAVMQLALSMDYAIVLLHAYKEKKNECEDKKEAMAMAIAKSIAPVSSSSLTTIAGLVALMFMSFSIGFDVGLVLAKGILISLLAVFLFMPALLLIFDKLLVKTTHKSIDQVLIEANEKRIKKYQNHGKEAPTFSRFQKRTMFIIPALTVIIVLIGAILNYKSEYSFVLQASSDENAKVNVDDENISKIFGTQNTMVVLLDKDTYTYEEEQEVINYLKTYTYNDELIFNSALGLTTYGVNIPYTSTELVKVVEAKAGIALDEMGIEIVNQLYSDVSQMPNNPMKTNANGELTCTLEDLVTFVVANESTIENTILAKVTEIDSMFYDYTTSPIGAVSDAKVTQMQMALAQLGQVPESYLTLDQKVQKVLLYVMLSTWTPDLICQNIPALPKIIVNSIYQKAGQTQMTGYELMHFLVVDYKVNQSSSVIALLAASVMPKVNAVVEELSVANKTFRSENYVRIIMNMNMPISGEESFEAINDITDHLYSTYDKIQVVSETFVYSQIKDVFNKDIVKVNIISFVAILVIIALTFKSYFVPLLLTLLIQGAIWITMGISTMAGQDIFFICYIVVMCVQMGATIDYAILLTTNYKENRKTMNKINAMGKAMNSSLMTIFTSGSILILATLIIGLVSDVKIIADLGLLLTRGCAISVFTIIFCLPQFLMLFDKLIEKTTFKTTFYNGVDTEFEKIKLESIATSDTNETVEETTEKTE